MTSPLDPTKSKHAEATNKIFRGQGQIQKNSPPQRAIGLPRLTVGWTQHSRTKHIDVRHHFIRDHQQKGDICIESMGTEDQLADIVTKPLDEKRFCKLRNELNILDFSNMC